MKWAFLINGIVQLCIAILMYLGVFQLIPELSKIASLSIGVLALISILFYKNYSETTIERQVFLCFMFYNAAVSMISYSSNPIEFPNKIASCLIHLGLFVLLLFAYMSELKPDKTTS